MRLDGSTLECREGASSGACAGLWARATRAAPIRSPAQRLSRTRGSSQPPPRPTARTRSPDGSQRSSCLVCVVLAWSSAEYTSAGRVVVPLSNPAAAKSRPGCSNVAPLSPSGDRMLQRCAIAAQARDRPTTSSPPAVPLLNFPRPIAAHCDAAGPAPSEVSLPPGRAFTRSPSHGAPVARA